MRQAFVNTLSELAAQNPQLLLLTGDLGFKLFDDFRFKYPKQFLNAGVAESNMMGLAAGLSLEGKSPFVYSIATFLIMRPFEQIRNDICFHNANVKLVGVGGGFSYGPNGTSHHALNDVALMRALPEMSVLCPGDPWEARWALEQAFDHHGPVYVRLGRGQDEHVHPARLALKWGQGILMREGQDVGIIASGLMLKTAVDVADELQKKGLSVRLVSMPSVKPLDERMVRATFEQCTAVFTLEEHYSTGGLGSAVMEWGVRNSTDTSKLHCFAVPDITFHDIGSQEYLRRQAGLGVDQIVQHIAVAPLRRLC